MKRAIFLSVCFAAAASIAAVNYEELVKSAETSGNGVAPISSIWQKENEIWISKATAPEVIAACVESREKADALLAEVKTAYETDPVAAVKIAEVTHYVMDKPNPPWWAFWRSSREGERRIWTEALLERAKTAADDYVKIFCLDQLRWCAFPEQSPEILSVGEEASGNVAKFAAQVAKEVGDRRS